MCMDVWWFPQLVNGNLRAWWLCAAALLACCLLVLRW